MKTEITSLIGSPFWLPIKSGIIVVATYLGAKLTRYLLDRWSQRRLN